MRKLVLNTTVLTVATLGLALSWAGDTPTARAEADDAAPAPAAAAAAAAATESALPGMVHFAGTDAQPIGIDKKELDEHLETVGRLGVGEGAYERALLISTPQHEVAVSPFMLAKYELTNAQWRLFLMSTEQKFEMPVGENLVRLAGHLWKLEGEGQGKALQQGWMYLMERNWDVLQPILNPENAGDWDPLVAKAGEIELPEGLELWYSLYMPPPQLKGDPKKRLVVAEGQEKFPARFVSWEAAMDFCRWAGIHVPRERELEHAMRGVEGRRYAWGNDWEPWRAVWRGYNTALKPITPRGEPLTDEQEAYNAAMAAATAGGEYVAAPGGGNITGPLPVDTLPPSADGLHHLQGNVSEWALEAAVPYDGSKCSFRYWHTSRVARGGSYDEHAAFFHAADRTTQGTYAYLPPTAAESNRGLRPAAYSLPGQDLTVGLMEPFHSFELTSGPHTWLPIPPGLSNKDSDPTARDAHIPFQGFDDTVTAGYIERQMKQSDENHVYVTGAAKGIAVLPAKGFASPVVKSASDFKKFSEKDDVALLVGVLTGTDLGQLGFKVLDPKTPADSEEEAKKLTLSFNDDMARSDAPELARKSLPLGYFLVLEGERVAVYEPNPRRHGSAQAHLTSRDPLGYLAAPWKAERVKLWQKKDVPNEKALPSATKDGNSFTLRFPIRELDKKGVPQTKMGKYATMLTIKVDVAGW